MTNIRLILACRRELFREGLAQLLRERAPHLDIVARCSSAMECIKKVGELKPDVILLDTEIQDSNATEVSSNITKLYPQSKILILSCSDDGHDLVTAMQAGARAYISKDVSMSSLVDDIERVYTGEIIISSPMAEKILNKLRMSEQENVQDQEEHEYNLSKREHEVLALVTQGKTNREIAKALFITENTVKVHLGKILEKMHVRTRYQAALLFAKKPVISANNNLQELQA